MQDQMSPDASPGVASKNTGVRRVNNMPVYIIGGLMSVFLLVMVLVAADRAAKQNRPAEAKEEKAASTSMFAKELAGDQKDGIVQSQQEASALVIPDLSTTNTKTSALTVARPTNLDTPPPPLGSSQNQQLQAPQTRQLQRMPRDDEMDRFRAAKLQQFEEAVKAKTSVQITTQRTNSAAPLSRDETLARLAAVRQQIETNTRDDPTAAYKARLAQIQAAGLGGISTGVSAAPRLIQTAASGNGRNDLGQFSGSGQGDRWKLDSQPEAPHSPYELRAGFVIPAMMVSGINSDLPGQVIAQVSQDVYDTATGKYKLIPQGCRLVGNYSSDIAFGQARMFVVWQRIIFPDGKAMDIGAMPGSDSAGYSGFSDQVNNHYARLFGSAFLLSGVTAGVALSQPKVTSSNTAQTATSAMSEALGQQLGQVTAQLIAKNMTIAPTLEIRPGYRFNVMVTKDMNFSKPYQAFDY